MVNKLGMSERDKWCFTRAFDFVLNKRRNRCYPYQVSFDGDVHTQYFALSPEDEEMVSECPNDLSDCGVDWGKYIQCPSEFYDGVPATVLSVDLSKPAGLYTFTRHKNYAGEKQCVVREEKVVLTDKQYVQLLAMLIDDPEMTFGELVLNDVDLYTCIIRQVYSRGSESAIFMTELYKDAQTILSCEKYGL